MKIGRILAATLYLLPYTAWAIHPPVSATAIQEIEELIRKANAIQSTNKDSQGVDDNVQKTELKLATELSKISRDYKTISALRQHLKDLKTQRDVALHLAIRKTLVAYGMLAGTGPDDPIMPVKMAVHPRFKGRQAQWIVVYKDNEERTVLNNKGEREPVPPVDLGKAKAGGMTAADGVTTIVGELTTANDLALLLYHEQAHFEQFTTRGVGDKLTSNEREVKAYLAQYRQLRNFGLSPSELQMWDVFLAGKNGQGGKVREFQSKVENDKFIEKVSLGSWSSSEPASVEPHTQDELDAIKKRAQEIDAHIQQQARNRKEVEQRRQRHEREHLTTLEALARRACDDPWAVKQAELDALRYQPRETYEREKNFLYNVEAPCGVRLHKSMLWKLAEDGALNARWLYSTSMRMFLEDGSRSTVKVPDAQAVPVPPYHTPIRALVWSNLYTLAVAACDDPAGVTEEFSRAYQIGFPDGDGSAHYFSYSGCAGRLYQLLMGFNASWKPGNRINREWLLEKASELRAEPQTNPAPGSGPQRSPEQGDAPRSHPRGGIDTKPGERARDRIPDFRFPK